MKARIQAHAAHSRALRCGHAAALLAAVTLAAAPSMPPGSASGMAAKPDDEARIQQEGPAAPKANDPGLAKQAFLHQIGAQKAWKLVTEQTSITIAVVDTGVDLDHPDLQPNLLPGINLLKPDEPPRDDNGHGTSVAGVVAAAGNNGKGVAGVIWKARILPIKALDRNGYGDERQLGEGIRKAISEGARIVVLSVGLYHSSPYMRDIAALAEQKGVLLVAAAGNDGRRFGSRAAVKYPAAYPTVLAVGGVGPDGLPDSRSNQGPELDIAAPWKVYTTAAGGGYHYVEGTSMAAPQAAAAAALLWAKYPSLKPYQIRSMLRQTAKDEGAKGFDYGAGYGLLRIDSALADRYKADPHEPDDSAKTAAALPLGKQLSGQLSGTGDRDWYRLECPYDGIVSLDYTQLTSPGAGASAVRIELEEAGSVKKMPLKLRNHKLEWHVRKGTNRLMLRLEPGSGAKQVPYLLSTRLRMLPDKGESNDTAGKAYPLADRSLEFQGTFHQAADVDWYSIRVAKKGTMRLQVEAGTMRMDPAFSYRRAGGEALAVDSNGEGVAETSPLIPVTPGTYEIKVWDAGEDAAAPATGYYTLKVTRGG
ncbi:S8 family serine peptidase [Paenibacillus sp. P22]|uniref:S8 family serine peptidase n=1 Tax=Paenibacillus sp. P22 TaxID=483908 RepID=UPI00043099AB|nr:S8 family serine peptidase [Paenibacillus sp. P22]CDN42944.1 hypothetical protein BN871_CF_00090 [Paenibacillus sp. P22]